MGGVIRGIGRAVGGVVRGVGSAVGGVVRGVGYLAQGKLGKAVGSVVGGVVKGSGEVLKGGLGAVKDVLGDPIVGAAAGFALMGPAGLFLGPMIGKLGSKVAGAAEQGVSNLFGLNQPQYQNLAYGQNYNSFGPYNAQFGAYPGGLCPPFMGGGYGAPYGSNFFNPMSMGMGGYPGMGMGGFPGMGMGGFPGMGMGGFPGMGMGGFPGMGMGYNPMTSNANPLGMGFPQSMGFGPQGLNMGFGSGQNVTININLGGGFPNASYPPTYNSCPCHCAFA